MNLTGAKRTGCYRPIADMSVSCDARTMQLQKYVQLQRKGVNAIFAAFATLLSAMWVATVCDQVFALGWGWDRQILWLAPPMLLFAVFVRFCCMAIFRFVEGAYDVR